MLQRTGTDRRGASTTRSTSTGVCPAARTQLLQLEGLTLPTPDVPGLGREMQTITMDGAGYRLKVQALYDGDAADLTLESNVDTPLARWIDSALDTLSACWRDAGS